MTDQPLIQLYCDNQRSPHTARNALYRLRHFAQWLAEHYHVTELEGVTTAHLLAYKGTLTHLAPSSQARIIETLRGFFRWAYSEHLIERDPAAQIKSPRATLNKEPEYLTIDETRRLIAVIDPQSLYAVRDRALLWALAYGLRVGEVAALNVGDVLPAKAGKLPALRITGKGTRQRVIPIGPAAHTALLAYLAPRGKVGKGEPLFMATYAGAAGRMTTRAIQKRIKVLCDNAGIDPAKAHPHAWRHGAAMRWLFETTTPGGVYTVSRLLGHSAISTTERYLHLNREALEQAVIGDPLNALCLDDDR